jgi:hypothetical protein
MTTMSTNTNNKLLRNISFPFDWIENKCEYFDSTGHPAEADPVKEYGMSGPEIILTNVVRQNIPTAE